MRILWSSNAMWAKTGYGVQAQYLLPRLQQLGHTVAQFAWYGLQGARIKVGEIVMYPAVADPWGSDVIAGHVKDFRADLVLSLHDIWVLPPDYASRFDAVWAPWFPVDHTPVPQRVLEVAKTAPFPVVYSRFGHRQMEGAGVKCWYIPHGVETSVFKPGDKRAARERLRLPADAYIVDIVAANKGYPSRKALCENIEAFARFRAKHPEAILYLHTALDRPDGIDLSAYLQALGLTPEAVKAVPQYAYHMGLPDTYMADVYVASDCHLAASTSEGFGIPILEAQACGTPVITTNCTSMPELTWAGIAVEPYQRLWTPMQSWVAAVSIDAVADALEEIYRWPAGLREHKGAWAVKQAQEYDWDALALNYWDPFLKEVEAYIQEKAKPEATA